MTNNVEILEEVRLANEAEQLLNNKILKDAFAEVERQYLEAFLAVDVKEDLGRFRFSEAIKVLRLVRQQLNTAVQNGKLSAYELKQMGGKKRTFF